MWIAILLGFLQGITEWLPVSSEGVTVTAYSTLYGAPLDESLSFALWLHLGTSIAAVVAFRGDLVRVSRKCFKMSSSSDHRLTFKVLLPLAISGFIGLPLLIALGGLSTESGAVAMAVVGGAMLITGGLQYRNRKIVYTERTRRDMSSGDGIALGVAQGIAVVPGLSRSGLTVAVLLARHMDRRDALVISFLIGIPASLAAALYVAVTDGLVITNEALLALGVAAVVGLITIHMLMAVVQRINFGAAILVIGCAILAGSAFQLA